ncbi:hypothetical protein ACHAO4_008623 [Trichoderma viride]
MAPANPCTNPNLPPIRIELSDIPCDESHAQYINGVLVVKAYWRQATNMTLKDQVEYQTLIEQQCFEMQPPWYVFIKALDIGTYDLDSEVQGIFGSLRIGDFGNSYRAYHPEPARELKRKAVDQLQQRSDGSSQQNTSPALGQKLPFNVDLQRLENHLKEYMDRRFGKIQNSFFEARTDERNKIRTATEQIALVLEKMNQLEREQTEYFNAMEKKIDRIATTQRSDWEEI